MLLFSLRLFSSQCLFLLMSAHSFRHWSYLCIQFECPMRVSFNLFSAILLGIICLVLIWSCAGVDLAVAIVSYHDIIYNCVCTQTMTRHPFVSSHRFIKNNYCNPFVRFFQPILALIVLNFNKSFKLQAKVFTEHWFLWWLQTDTLASSLHASYIIAHVKWSTRFPSHFSDKLPELILCSWRKNTTMIREGISYLRTQHSDARGHPFGRTWTQFRLPSHLILANKKVTAM